MARPEAASALGASPPVRTPNRDPLPAQVISWFLLALLTALLLGGREGLILTFKSDWAQLAFWVSLVVVIDLFPVAVGGRTLTLDMPLLLAVALLYPPAPAAGVALIGAIDVREFTGEVGVSRAVFNRVQIGLSVFAASAVFRALGGSLDRWTVALPAAVVALVADYVTNALLVTLHAGARERVSPPVAAARLRVGSYREFLVAYLGYGLFAVALARLFQEPGPWAVAISIAPLLVARTMLVKSQQTDELAERVAERERAMLNSLDSIVDERRDERERIAGELHDDVLQSLMAILILGKEIEGRSDLEDSAEDARELVNTAALSIQSFRAVISDLGSSPLGRRGLVPTLRGLVRDLRLEQKPRIVCDLPPQDVDLPPRSKVLVYQIAREALLNSLRHAKATEIRLALSTSLGQLRMEVEDNGVGFDLSDRNPSQQFGLALMEARARRLGAKLTIASRAGYGTRLQLTVPSPTAISE